jgi:hypothetical protein
MTPDTVQLCYLPAGSSKARALRYRFGLPEGVGVGLITLTLPWKRVEYEIELIGIPVMKAPESAPVISIDTDGKSLTFSLWRQIARRPGADTYFERLWTPQFGFHESVHGKLTKANINKALMARAVLTSVIKGRHIGSTKLSKKQFLERAPLKYKEWMKELDERPTDVQFAEVLRISKSTLYNYFRDYGSSMNDIEERSHALGSTVSS